MRNNILKVKISDSAIIAALCLILGQSGCSFGSAKSNLKSSIHSASSLAAESVLFLDYIDQGRARRPFVEAHLQYLLDSVDKVSKDLDQSRSGTPEIVNQSRGQLDLLRTELLASREAQKTSESLAQVRSQIDRIQRVLHAAESHL
jgi:hypothetical protein